MKTFDDFHWIVRSAGERTTDLCVHLIEREYTTSPVTVLREAPFSKAVEETLRQGHACGKRWTVCLDADVLLFGNGMKRLLRLIQKDKYKAFCYQALIYDKLIPIRRPAGIHVYDNGRALMGIEHIPANGNAIRPESFMTSQMAEAGHKTLQTPFLIGLHDFEQYYKDLFRKSILHSNKHIGVLDTCEAYWRKQKHSDADYAVALDGCLAGKLIEENLKVDKNFWKDKTDEYLERFGLEEKSELEISDEGIGQLKRQFHNRHIINTVQRYKNPDHRDIYFRFEDHEGRRQGRLKERISIFGNRLYHKGKQLKEKV